MRHIAPLPIVFASLAVLACGDSAQAPGAAGGAGAGPDVMLTLATEDVYTAGAMEGEDWEIFGRIRSVAFDETGKLHILDAQARRVVVVGPDGSFLRTVGKPGEGPGEFSSLIGLVVQRDGKYAAINVGSIHLFDADGEFTGSVPADMATGMPLGAQGLPDGRLVSRNMVRINLSGAGRSGGLEIFDPEGRPIEVFPLDGGVPELLYTAWKLPQEDGDGGAISTTSTTAGASMSMQRSAPRAFVPGLHMGVLSDGRIAVVDSVGYRVKLVGMDGSVTGTVERPIPPTVVTEAIRELERGRLLAEREAGNAPTGEFVVVSAGSSGTSSASSTTLGSLGGSGRVQLNSGSIEDMTFAAEIPVIDDIAVDWENRIWVERTGENGQGPGLIDIMTPDGGYVGTLPADGLRIPWAFGPNGLMAYVESDDFDVQTVRVIRLVSLGR